MAPRTFEEYIGQDAIKVQLEIAINASLRQNKPLPHILLSGREGLGKTTLAEVIASEMGANIHKVLGLNIKSKEDLIKVLSPISDPPVVGNDPDTGKPIFDMTNFTPDILFIDEIHGLPKAVEEMFYPVMSDFEMEVETEDYHPIYGIQKRVVRGWVPPFTIIGATTMEGNLSAPFLRRFGMRFVLQDYTEDHLKSLIFNYCIKNNIPISERGAESIASRSRGSASYAVQYTQRCYDYAIAFNIPQINKEVVDQTFALMNIDDKGLSEIDYKILSILAETGKALGVTTLVNAVGLDKTSYEKTVEPFLLKAGYIRVTPRGRIITVKGFEALGMDTVENVTMSMPRIGFNI